MMHCTNCVVSWTILVSRVLKNTCHLHPLPFFSQAVTHYLSETEKKQKTNKKKAIATLRLQTRSDRAAWGTGDLRCSFCFDCSGSCDLWLTEVKQVIWELRIYFVLFFWEYQLHQGKLRALLGYKSGPRAYVFTANLLRFPLCDDSDGSARIEDLFTGTFWDCAISQRKWNVIMKKWGRQNTRLSIFLR